ncbi:MAG TPA: hypothetical protein VMR14_00430 [Streptosporangiaceae bacterium]|jgi:hypothetical protein|nr:hypothetical protein [Streptosporangiaceae bacterium]
MTTAPHPSSLSRSDQFDSRPVVPVTAGLQAQGDLIVIPIGLLTGSHIYGRASWRIVPAMGLEILRSAAGGNPHALTAEAGTCQWTDGVHDDDGLALGALTARSVAYLIHPEHGMTGIAPGTYIIRRQRERSAEALREANRLIAD